MPSEVIPSASSENVRTEGTILCDAPGTSVTAPYACSPDDVSMPYIVGGPVSVFHSGGHMEGLESCGGAIDEACTTRGFEQSGIHAVRIHRFHGNIMRRVHGERLRSSSHSRRWHIQTTMMHAWEARHGSLGQGVRGRTIVVVPYTKMTCVRRINLPGGTAGALCV